MIRHRNVNLEYDTNIDRAMDSWHEVAASIISLFPQGEVLLFGFDPDFSFYIKESRETLTVSRTLALAIHKHVTKTKER